MPLKLCQVCQKKKTVRTNDTKYLDHDGEYVCSVPCLLSWIRQDHVINFPTTARNGNKDRCGCMVTSSHLNKSFRSVYEASFAELFVKNKLMFMYEWTTFFWDGKEYTPDFYFVDYKCFVEVKGGWNPSNRSKYRSFRKAFPNVDLLVAHWLLAPEVPKAHILGGV